MAELPQQQYARELDEIEAEMASLKVTYDQYFIGLEKKEPFKRREDLRKRILRLKEVFMKNTGLKFRMQTVHQKYLSYERLWLRTLKEIEEGTYKRHLFKAKMHATQKQPEAKKAAGNGAQAAAIQPAAAQEPTPAPPPAPQEDLALTATVAATAGKRKPSAPGQSALSEDRVKALYEAYVTAKQRTNESTAGLSPETLAATLRKQLPSLMQKHNAKDIDFKVVIKGGKALLKAVPKT